jgi:hypothetical protein
MTTDVDTLVARLTGLLERTTPGPWTVGEDGWVHAPMNGADDVWDVAAPLEACGEGPAPDFDTPHNAALIAAAVNALPDLLAERTRLQQRVAVLEQALTALCDAPMGALTKAEVWVNARAALTGETKP